MRHTMFLTTMFAAALLGSGVANAAGTLKASDYTEDDIVLGTNKAYDKLIVDTPLTLTGFNGYLDLYNGSTLAFSKVNGADAICSIFTSTDRDISKTVFFNNVNDVYNITFDAGAQTVVAASAGKAITLIQDLQMASDGFYFSKDPSQTTLKLNGAEAGNPVVLNGVQFTYVGPQAADYTFQEGEIGFTGYYDGSHNLSLVANGKPTPEPTTGSLSLLALAGLCARRRRK